MTDERIQEIISHNSDYARWQRPKDQLWHNLKIPIDVVKRLKFDTRLDKMQIHSDTYLSQWLNYDFFPFALGLVYDVITDEDLKWLSSDDVISVFQLHSEIAFADRERIEKVENSIAKYVLINKTLKIWGSLNGSKSVDEWLFKCEVADIDPHGIVYDVDYSCLSVQDLFGILDQMCRGLNRLASHSSDLETFIEVLHWLENAGLVKNGVMKFHDWFKATHKRLMNHPQAMVLSFASVCETLKNKASDLL